MSNLTIASESIACGVSHPSDDIETIYIKTGRLYKVRQFNDIELASAKGVSLDIYIKAVYRCLFPSHKIFRSERQNLELESSGFVKRNKLYLPK